MTSVTTPTDPHWNAHTEQGYKHLHAWVECKERAQREGWEGVIAKRRGSIYEHRRSKQWLKMKCELSQNFVVGGFTDPQGKRVGLGALLVGYHKESEFVFAGKIGTPSAP